MLSVKKQFGPADTLYPPGSVAWRVNREAALLLGGGRALLMQLAHPGVAAGVAEHSDYRSRPLVRLRRTLELTLAISFGTRAHALEAARLINRTHLRVRGAGYSATDPSLLLWVHATLVDSALVTHQAFVRPLSFPERQAYYEQTQVVGGLLGIPESAFPSGLAGFESYMADTLRGSELAVDARARELAAAVLRPRVRFAPRLVFAPTEAITAGLLGEPLRSKYGLAWGAPDRVAFAAARAAIPRALPLLPSKLRYLRAPKNV